VLDRVLDDRLQDQARHERAARRGIEIERDAQAIREARGLDFEVPRE
jgi:hypothetical protein